MRRYDHARGLRWGRLLASLETASKALAIAHGCRDLLTEKEADRLKEIQEAVADMEFVAWGEENSAAKKLPKRKR